MDSVIAVVVEFVFGWIGAYVLHFFLEKPTKNTLKEKPLASVTIGIALVGFVSYGAWMIAH